jgi:hypothetical protein
MSIDATSLKTRLQEHGRRVQDTKSGLMLFWMLIAITSSVAAIMGLGYAIFNTPTIGIPVFLCSSGLCWLSFKTSVALSV